MTARAREHSLVSTLLRAATQLSEKGTSCSWAPSAVYSLGGPMLMCFSCEAGEAELTSALHMLTR